MAPDEVAYYADWPINENDRVARSLWLANRKESLQAKLEGDPEYYDAKIAGWWAWGMCCTIGGRFAWGNGPWVAEDGELVYRPGHGGIGTLHGIPDIGNFNGLLRRDKPVSEYLRELSARLRYVRVCCGNWDRILRPERVPNGDIIGVFLDPPYSAPRQGRLYAEDDITVSKEVEAWALAHGNNPRYRIVLAGYEGEHEMSGWGIYEWQANGGYGNQGEKENINKTKERLWYSQYCHPMPVQAKLALGET